MLLAALRVFVCYTSVFIGSPRAVTNNQAAIHVLTLQKGIRSFVNRPFPLPHLDDSSPQYRRQSVIPFTSGLHSSTTETKSTRASSSYGAYVVTAAYTPAAVLGKMPPPRITVARPVCWCRSRRWLFKRGRSAVMRCSVRIHLNRHTRTIQRCVNARLPLAHYTSPTGVNAGVSLALHTSLAGVFLSLFFYRLPGIEATPRPVETGVNMRVFIATVPLCCPYFPCFFRAFLFIRVRFPDGGDSAGEAEGLQRRGGADHVRRPNLRRIEARVRGDRGVLDRPRKSLSHDLSFQLFFFS